LECGKIFGEGIELYIYIYIYIYMMRKDRTSRMYVQVESRIRTGNPRVREVEGHMCVRPSKTEE
jgi:hypothetical protein